MRHSFTEPPSTVEDLGALRVHEAVRDYPELLPVLRDLGVDLPEGGCALLGDVTPPGQRRELLAALAWRREGGDGRRHPPVRDPEP